MTHEPVRLLYVPNEAELGAQHGPRLTFEEMVAEKALDGYEAFALPYEWHSDGPASLDRLRLLIQRFGPTHILWQHTLGIDITVDYLESLKMVPSGPILCYQNLDPWGTLRKRLPRTSRALARAAHLVLTCGQGSFRRAFKRIGAKAVGYSPHGVDLTRFDNAWTPTAERRFDVVMIANRVPSRFGLSPIPGANQRARLAELLREQHGSRFHVFGRGWADLGFAEDPIPYIQQVQASQEAFVTVNWDHFPREPYYFSDRLPIALTAAVPHVTTWHPGYDELFPSGVGLYSGKSTKEVAAEVRRVLEFGPESICAIGVRARQFARDHLSQDRVMKNTIELMTAHRSGFAGNRG